jgi:hypothetical protein
MSIQEEENQSLHVPSTPLPGRIRSHSLKPQHSRIDYARRKSAADISSSIVSCFSSSTDEGELEKSPRTPSPSWFKRRFTFFALDQPIDEKRRMTTDRLSSFDEKSYADLLKQKRPSFIAQMMEVESFPSLDRVIFSIFDGQSKWFLFLVIRSTNFSSKEKT